MKKNEPESHLISWRNALETDKQERKAYMQQINNNIQFHLWLASKLQQAGARSYVCSFKPHYFQWTNK